MVCSWFRDTAGWMLGSITWIFSLGCVPGSSSVCVWSVPQLFGPGGVAERKYVLSVVWPVAAKVRLDAATRKSALSKNLRFFLILDFSRVSSSVPNMCLSWVHISPSSMYILVSWSFHFVLIDWYMRFFSVNFLIPCCPGAMGDFPQLRYCRFGPFVSLLFCCKGLSCGGTECAFPFPAQISPESELGAQFQLVFHRLMKYLFCKVWLVWRDFGMYCPCFACVMCFGSLIQIVVVSCPPDVDAVVSLWLWLDLPHGWLPLCSGTVTYVRFVLESRSMGTHPCPVQSSMNEFCYEGLCFVVLIQICAFEIIPIDALHALCW